MSHDAPQEADSVKFRQAENYSDAKLFQDKSLRSKIQILKSFLQVWFVADQLTIKSQKRNHVLL